MPVLRTAGRKTVDFSLKRADLRTAGRIDEGLSLKRADLRTAGHIDEGLSLNGTDLRTAGRTSVGFIGMEGEIGWLFGVIFCKFAGFLNKKDKNASY